MCDISGKASPGRTGKSSSSLSTWTASCEQTTMAPKPGSAVSSASSRGGVAAQSCTHRRIALSSSADTPGSPPTAAAAWLHHSSSAARTTGIGASSGRVCVACALRMRMPNSACSPAFASSAWMPSPVLMPYVRAFEERTTARAARTRRHASAERSTRHVPSHTPSAAALSSRQPSGSPVSSTRRGPMSKFCGCFRTANRRAEPILQATCPSRRVAGRWRCSRCAALARSSRRPARSSPNSACLGPSGGTQTSGLAGASIAHAGALAYARSHGRALTHASARRAGGLADRCA